MHKSRALACALAAAVGTLIAGCGPSPSDRTAANYRATRFAVTPVDQKLEIDGCSVTVNRITTGIGDSLNDFTLAVARCPTATVTTVNQGCGRSCASNSILVEPAARATAQVAPAGSAVPSDVPAGPAP